MMRICKVNDILTYFSQAQAKVLIMVEQMLIYVRGMFIVLFLLDNIILVEKALA